MFNNKKIIILFLTGLGISAYLLYAATNEQYDTVIGGYNNAFNVAYSLWQTPLAARPVNWEDTFADAVQDARRAFTTLKLYWEHDKRTVGPRDRASKRIMTLTAIPGLPRPTNAVDLLKQHEEILAQMEAAIGTRSALQRKLNDFKLLVSSAGQEISTKLGAAQRNINTNNYQQANTLLDEAKKLLDCLLGAILDTDPAGYMRNCRAQYGL